MAPDYCKIFTNDSDHLYTLSLLLTADPEKAEQCFVAGLEDCVEGNAVFREWAQAWATRTIIKNAIQMIAPLRNETATTTEIATKPISEADALVLAITRLPRFERFVYVMSVLEGYPDRECSLLLSCTLKDIAKARTHAFERLTDLVSPGRRQVHDPPCHDVVLSPVAVKPNHRASETR